MVFLVKTQPMISTIMVHFAMHIVKNIIHIASVDMGINLTVNHAMDRRGHEVPACAGLKPGSKKHGLMIKYRNHNHTKPVSTFKHSKHILLIPSVRLCQEKDCEGDPMSSSLVSIPQPLTRVKHCRDPCQDR